jgi:hypothetical protein
MLVCPKCGGQEFSANQTCTCDIIVDSKNEFLRNNTEDDSVYISWADDPYGPYYCTSCGTEYDDLENELIERDDLIGRRIRRNNGEEGVITSIDVLGRFHVNIDNGPKLLFAPGANKYEILEPEEEEDEEEGEDVRILLKNVSFEELSRVREFLNNQEIEVEEL